MTWISVATKPEYDRVVLVYDSLHKQIGLAWLDRANIWMWPMNPNMTIPIRDSEGQISHWTYPPTPASEAWGRVTENSPEREKPVLLYHPQWQREYSIGSHLRDGRWQLNTATFGRSNLAPFFDDEKHIHCWMPLPASPNL